MFERDNTGASILTRAASVDNFVEVIKFLVSAGCKVTENVLNWIRVRNPDCCDLAETSFRVPGSLMQQSRVRIWSLLRQSGAADIPGYREKMKVMAASAQIPLILVDYLECRV